MSRCIHIITPWWSLNLKHHQQQRLWCAILFRLCLVPLCSHPAAPVVRGKLLVMVWVICFCGGWLLDSLIGQRASVGPHKRCRPISCCLRLCPCVWLPVRDKEWKHRQNWYWHTRRCVWVRACRVMFKGKWQLGPKSDFVLITQSRCWGQIFSNTKCDLGQFYSYANFCLQREFTVLLSVPCCSYLNVLVFRPMRVFLKCWSLCF